MRSPIRYFLILLFIVTNMASPLWAEGEIIYLDGRKIQLEANGHWKYLSTDRFIITPDGRRIRLRDNGTWEVTDTGIITPSHASTASSSGTNMAGQTFSDQPMFAIQKGIIEKREKKVQKNTRVKTHTVITLQVALPAIAEYNLDLSSIKPNQFILTDNHLEPYPILGIESSEKQLEPSGQATFIIHADGSPGWFADADELILTIKKGAFHLQQPRRLVIKVRNLNEEKVDTFSSSP